MEDSKNTHAQGSQAVQTVQAVQDILLDAEYHRQEPLRRNDRKPAQMEDVNAMIEEILLRQQARRNEYPTPEEEVRRAEERYSEFEKTMEIAGDAEHSAKDVLFSLTANLDPAMYAQEGREEAFRLSREEQEKRLAPTTEKKVGTEKYADPAEAPSQKRDADRLDPQFFAEYKKYKQNRHVKIQDFLKEADLEEKEPEEVPRQEAARTDSPSPEAGAASVERPVTDYQGGRSERETAEYRTEEDAPRVFGSLKRLRRNLSFRVVLLAVLCCVSFYVCAAAVWNGWLPRGLHPDLNQTGYLLFQGGMLLAAAAGTYMTIFRGIWALFRLKPGHDTLPALAVLICLLQCGILLASPAGTAEAVTVYAPAAIFGLLLNLIGKRIHVSRAMLNFQFVANTNFEKYSVNLMENEEIAQAFTKGALSDEPYLAVNRKADFLTDFMYHSFREDVTDLACRAMAPLLLVFSAVIGFLLYQQGGGAAEVITGTAAAFCFTAPAGYLLASALPQMRAARQLHTSCGAVLGYEAIDEFSDLNSCAVDARKPFPEGTVVLEGIKTFAGTRIDEAILDAASILHESNSILDDVFMQVIMERTDILKPVDTIVYEDAMGISAWVDNRRVLIGTREMMMNHNIDVPSRDYENRYLKGGKEFVYLAVSGELAAVFAFSLHADEKVARALKSLQHSDTFVIIWSIDPILTKQRLASLFHVEPALFKVLPSRYHDVYKRQTAPGQRLSGAVCDDGTFPSYVSAMMTAARLRPLILIGMTLMFASALTAAVMTFYFSCFGGISYLSVLFSPVYHLLFILVLCLIPPVRKG